MIRTPVAFFDAYDLCASTADPLSPRGMGQRCHFCDRSYPEVTFRQRTHLLPELLGRNECLRHDECDACNRKYGVIEKDLSTFLLPYRTMLGSKGKRGIPKFHSRSYENTQGPALVAEHSSGQGLQLTVRHPDACVIDAVERTGTVTFHVPQFTPLKVYRALVKIGLGMLPSSEIAAHRHVLEWLGGRLEYVPFSADAFLHELRQRYWTSPCAYLYRAKALEYGGTELPEYALVVCTSNVVLQIFMPFTVAQWSDHDPARTLSYIPFPGFAWDKFLTGSRREIKVYDLSVDKVVTYDLPISFTFDALERVELSDDGAQ